MCVCVCVGHMCVCVCVCVRVCEECARVCVCVGGVYLASQAGEERGRGGVL